MRIIAGEHRGRRLESVKGRNTRPTSDRVKESIFNIIQTAVRDSEVLDLFAGTGNLGLEAISRGSRQAVFVEKDPSALNVLRRNCEILGCLTQSHIYPMDVYKAIDSLSKEGSAFNIIFMDPPYQKGFEIPVIERILQKGILKETGIVIVEHESRDIPPDRIKELSKVDLRKYGSTSVSFYRRGE